VKTSGERAALPGDVTPSRLQPSGEPKRPVELHLDKASTACTCSPPRR